MFPCRTWRLLGSSPCLWTALDLCAHCCESDTATALAGWCAHLRRRRFRGADAAATVMNLQARGLQEIAGDYCRAFTAHQDCLLRPWRRSPHSGRHRHVASLPTAVWSPRHSDVFASISSIFVRHVRYSTAGSASSLLNAHAGDSVFLCPACTRVLGVTLGSGLEGCDPRFTPVFVKGIGFLVRLTFKGDPSWGRRFNPVELLPFMFQSVTSDNLLSPPRNPPDLILELLDLAALRLTLLLQLPDPHSILGNAYLPHRLPSRPRQRPDVRGSRRLRGVVSILVSETISRRLCGSCRLAEITGFVAPGVFAAPDTFPVSVGYRRSSLCFRRIRRSFLPLPVFRSLLPGSCDGVAP